MTAHVTLGAPSESWWATQKDRASFYTRVAKEQGRMVTSRFGKVGVLVPGPYTSSDDDSRWRKRGRDREEMSA